MKKNDIRTLTECAILIALSVVLSLIRIWQMPLGGSVTLVSMLPVCVISVRHGCKWGLGSAFVYSLFQLLLGIISEGLLGWGLNAAMLIGCMAFDYIIAFSVLGFAGMFRKKGEIGIYAGITTVCALRFVSHFLSGYVIFENLGQWELFGSTFVSHPVLYSICYNGFFMLPELVLTLVVTVILMRIPVVKNTIILSQEK